MRVGMGITLLAMLLLAYAVGGASAQVPARNTETKDEATNPAPAATPLPPPDMTLVPARDVRDAMLYLGGRMSFDEMAAVVYRELGDAFIAAQKLSAPPKR